MFFYLKKASLYFVIATLFVVSTLSFNNAVNNSVETIRGFSQQEREYENEIGPNIFQTSYEYNQETEEAIIVADYIVGHGESSTAANIPLYLGLTSLGTTEIPEQFTEWNTEDLEILDTVSSPTGWVSENTLIDVGGESSPATMCHATLKLEDVSWQYGTHLYNYDVIVQAHGSSGPIYGYYDIKPLGYTRIVDPFFLTAPTIEWTSESSFDLSTVYYGGLNPFNEVWMLDETSFNFSEIENIGAEVSFTSSQIVSGSYLLEFEVSNLLPGTVYEETTFTLDFIEDQFYNRSVTIEQTIPEFKTSGDPIVNPGNDGEEHYLAIFSIWLIVLIMLIITVISAMAYSKQRKNNRI